MTTILNSVGCWLLTQDDGELWKILRSDFSRSAGLNFRVITVVIKFFRGTNANGNVSCVVLYLNQHTVTRRLFECLFIIVIIKINNEMAKRKSKGSDKQVEVQVGCVFSNSVAWLFISLLFHHHNNDIRVYIRKYWPARFLCNRLISASCLK